MKKLSEILNEWKYTSDKVIHNDVYSYPYKLDDKTIQNICDITNNTVVKYMERYDFLFGSDLIYPCISFYVNINNPDHNIVDKYRDFDDNTLFYNCNIKQYGATRYKTIYYIALWGESRSHEIKDHYIKLLKELASYDCEVLEVYLGTRFVPTKLKPKDDTSYNGHIKQYYVDKAVNSVFQQFQSEIKKIDEECDDEPDDQKILKLPLSKKNQEKYEKLLANYNDLVVMLFNSYAK